MDRTEWLLSLVVLLLAIIALRIPGSNLAGNPYVAFVTLSITYGMPFRLGIDLVIEATDR